MQGDNSKTPGKSEDQGQKMDAPVYSIKAYNRYVKTLLIENDSELAEEKAEMDSAIGDGWNTIWAFVGIVGITSGVTVAKRFGIDVFRIDPKSLTLSILPWIAFVFSLLNLWSWAKNPQVDLKTLRTWLITPSHKHNLNNNHRLAIIVQMALVCSLCFTSTMGAFYLGLSGILVYLVNFIGFFFIMRHVEKAAEEANLCCEEDAPLLAQPFLKEAIKCIEKWWGVGARNRGLLKNPLQLRHMALVIVFIAVTVFGGIGQFGNRPRFSIVAYILGCVGLLGAVVSISVMRSNREVRLDDIDAKWTEAGRRAKRAKCIGA